MYHKFFGLNEQAFAIAVNPRYLYMSDQHREALAHLVYGIQVGGFVLLTGEVGTGKTTIIRCLLEQMPETTDIAIVLNPMASAPELLSTICDELGVRYVADHITTKDLVDALHGYLLKSHMKGRKTVLLIDEAQLLKPGLLEQIRLLTNLETTTEKLLQIILVGQPELKRLLARPSLRQLSQRITARFHLEALSLAETQAYIAHRLSVAGMPPHLNPFPPEIISKVHEFSGGVPRLINVLCERMLLGAYGKNQRVVDLAVYRQAATEVSGEAPPEPLPRYVWPRWHLGAIAGLILLLIASFMLGKTSNRVDPAPEVATTAGTPPEVIPTSSLSASSIDNTTVSPAVDAKSSAAAPPDPLVDLDSAVVPPVTPAEPPVFWVRQLTQAEQTLFRYVGVDPTADPCAASEGYACEKARLSTWDDLKDLNRPALLTLVTADKKLAYATLVGLDEDQALVLVKDRSRVVDWAQVAALWNGQVFYLWHRPPTFERPLMPGDKGRAVVWLAQQFAVLDQQDAPLSRDFFNPALKKRVEIFQAEHNLEADGIAGAETLRRLNEKLGLDKTLVNVDATISGFSRVE